MKCAWHIATRTILVFASIFIPSSAPPALAGDQPAWGQGQTRNMASPETGLVDSFDPAARKNVKWVSRLGTQTYSSPIIAGGKVIIGTNNDEPRDPAKNWDSGVLMCFDEKTGAFEWQLVSPKLEGDKFYDWPKTGMPSSATIEGDRVYMMTNRVELLCLDIRGMANGNDGPFKDEGAHMMPRGTDGRPTGVAEVGPKDADILWAFDVVKECGTWPHDGAHAAVLIDGPYLYLNTCNGVDNTHRKVRKPDAPSLIVLDKATGKLIARDEEKIGPRIFHSTWCSPTMTEMGGKRVVLFGGGDGVLYAFAALEKDRIAPTGEVARLKKLWTYDGDPNGPKENVAQYSGNKQVSPSNLYAMPVVVDGKAFVIPTGDWWWGKKKSSVDCLDLARPGPDGAPTRAWTYPIAGQCMTTPSVADGLLYVADSARVLHCIDVKTGQAVWTQKLNGEVWGSPVVADGKVYIGTRKGDFWILKAGRELKVLCQVDMGAPVSSTVGIANGVVFIPTAREIWAVGK